MYRFGFKLFVLFLFAYSSAAIAQQKPFEDSSVARDAEFFENYLQTQWPTKGKDAKSWRAEGVKAMQAGDPRSATGFFASSVVLDKNNAETWLALARAYIAIDTQKYSDKYSFARNAGSSAYIASLRSKVPAIQGQALAILAESLGSRSQWRTALAAYRASLAASPNEEVSTAYEEARASHGFRMLDYTVDNESSSPRVCVQFSEPLSKGKIDFSTFVTVNNERPVAVRAQDYQLCVEGLLHGRRYDVRIRSGLPAAVDDTTSQPIDLTVYVRDRTPGVRFTGRNYVLPRTGQQGVPVVSINTRSIKAKIYRIGDRRLAQEVLDGDFSQQLEGYRANQIASQKGEELWSGEMPVELKLNEEVTTAFPVDELLPDLKPGLYVLTALAGENTSEGDSVEDDWSERATQWFVVSDLGLTAFSGQDGVHVFVRSLASAKPVAGAELRLVARNNEILHTAKTDANGVATFDGGMARGTGGLAPALVVARGGDTDYGFLDLTKQAFDLSDRGVGGRVTPGPLDTMLFTERGVYRPGEKVFVTALLRDATAAAAKSVPLTLKLLRPDGVEARKDLLPDQGNGGRTLAIELPQTAMTGTWRVFAYADPKGASIGEAGFLVEDYTPERLDMTLTAADESLSPQKHAKIALEGRFLYGAPAANLGIEGEIVVSAAEGFERFPGFKFGLHDEAFADVRADLTELPETGKNGKATLNVSLPGLPQTSLPLVADVTVRLREPSGRALTRSISLDVDTGRSYIGVKPLFSGSVPDGEAAAFEVISLNGKGEQTAAKGLKWELFRVESRFQWYSRDGRWDFETVNYESRVAGGVIDASASAPVRIEAPVPSGSYRLDVVSGDAAPGTATSVTFYAGWYVSQTSDTPEILDLALDRATYKPGEQVKVQILPRMAGQALVAIVSDRVLETQLITVGEDGGSASFTVSPEWGPGTYATAILYRPMDSAAKRMPGRAVGVKWLPVDYTARQISVSLNAPGQARPGEPLTVPVSLSGLAAGEKAHLVVSAVDLGILNLTSYKTPKPESHFLGQRRLGLEMRDLYGRLIDGMQGVRGRIRSGGDGGGGMQMEGRPLNEEPVTLFSGLIEVGPDGTAEVTFDLPPFNGTVRLAAQAWTEKKVGHGEKDVIVRDPVVVQATPPKFLVLGDTSSVHLSLENVDAEPGQYTVQASASGGVSILGQADSQLQLDKGKRASVTLPVKATELGDGAIEVALRGPGDLEITRHYALRVEPPAENVTRRTTQTLAANTGSLRVNKALISDLAPDSAQVTVNISRAAALDVPGLLLGLDRYPYGCAEQLTSRALPLLYFNEVAAKARIRSDTAIKERIEKTIARLSELQSAAGGFGLWSPGDNLWLTAFVGDFLTRAKEAGYAVRPEVYGNALDRLKNTVNNFPEFEAGGEELAYSLYVLTRAGRGVLGDLRYYADTKLDTFRTPLARAQLGAALAMLGDRERAQVAFTSAFGMISPVLNPLPLATRLDFGTQLRDAAGALALMTEARMDIPGSAKAMSAVTALRGLQRGTTTQENLWLLLAARGLADQDKALKLEVDGKPVQGAFQSILHTADFSSGGLEVPNLGALALPASTGQIETTLTEDEFAGNGLTIKNAGADAVPASVIVTGSGLQPEPSMEAGFKIERRTYTPNGQEVKFDRVKQNDRIVVLLRVTETEAKLGHIIIEDRLPAGFEIENPALLKGSDLKAFSWLPTTFTPSHTGFRDDRFIAAYSLSDTQRQSPAQFTLAYVMRAVNPGVYTHPGAKVEDMYRPDRFARTSGGKVEVVAGR